MADIYVVNLRVPCGILEICTDSSKLPSGVVFFSWDLTPDFSVDCLTTSASLRLSSWPIRKRHNSSGMFPENLKIFFDSKTAIRSLKNVSSTSVLMREYRKFLLKCWVTQGIQYREFPDTGRQGLIQSLQIPLFVLKGRRVFLYFTSIKLTIAIIMGHCKFAKHTERPSIPSNDCCRSCGSMEEEENVFQQMCQCPALTRKSRRFLPSFFLKALTGLYYIKIVS